MIRASLGAAKPRRPLQRTPMKRGRTRVGAASAARRKAGGAIAQGRPATTLTGYQLLRAQLIARSGGYDEVYGKPLFGTDVAHVVARSQGGADTLDNTLWLARATHRQMEAPYANGRLVVTRVTVKGVRGFDWELVIAADKHAYRRGDFEVLNGGFIAAGLELEGHASA